MNIKVWNGSRTLKISTEGRICSPSDGIAELLIVDNTNELYQVEISLCHSGYCIHFSLMESPSNERVSWIRNSVAPYRIHRSDLNVGIGRIER